MVRDLSLDSNGVTVVLEGKTADVQGAIVYQYMAAGKQAWPRGGKPCLVGVMAGDGRGNYGSGITAVT
jgi:hypothetical protein